MPTITNKYPAGMAGGNSLDIVVEQGDAVSVVLCTATGAALPPGVQCPVQRKLSMGAYQRVPDLSKVPAYLTTGTPEAVFTAPGTYRVVVPATAVNVLVEEHR